MENKNITLLIVVAVLVALGIGGFYLYNATIQSSQRQNSELSGQGKIILGITDAAGSMNNISEVMVTVDKVQLHSQAEGWVTVSSEAQEFELLELKESGKIVMLAEANVQAGTYDQTRLNVSKVVIVDNGVQKEAKLPSGDLKIMGEVVVTGDATATAVFDFIADESIHVTGNGKYIFTPVIQMETRTDATVETGSDNELTISGGTVKANQKVGMDVNGEIKTDFVLDADTKIELVGTALKVVANNESDAAIKIKADAAITTALDKDYIDTATSVKLDTQNNEKVWVVSGLKGIEMKEVVINAQTGAVVTAQ